MAVTSLWPVKSRLDHVLAYACNPEKTKDLPAWAAMHQIESVTEYAANDAKTEHRELVTGINCTEEFAAKDFIETKQGFGKTDGRLCYHGYQSFAPGEVDGVTAHKIGVELAAQLWGDRFEVLVATHCNTGCYHNHFVINSVSFLDGMKFYNSRSDYRHMREVSDALCREYGLSIAEASGRGKNHAEWEAEKDGRPTRRGMICEDLERAIQASVTPEQFYGILDEMGYSLKTETATGELLKYPSIRPPGAKEYFRFHKLSKGYSWEEIMDRIYANMHRSNPFPEAGQRRNLPKPFVPYPKATGLRALYFRYCYELHILVKHPASMKRISFALREDITKLEQLDAQSRFLGLNQIDTHEQLDTYREQVQAQISGLDKQRRSLRYHLQKETDPEQRDILLSQIEDLGMERKELRRELVLCKSIEQRSIQVEQNLAALQAEQAIEAEEFEAPSKSKHMAERRREVT